MHIESLNIKGFGKLTNTTLTFSKGLNIISGNNEAGKSTLQEFIKGVLFGLKGGRTSKEGMFPPSKRFKPWKGDDFSGFIEYRLEDDKVYRAERNFNNNSIKVFDSLFNDITGDFEISKDRGALFADKHFEMNEACFERTVFIKQLESKIDEDGNKELLERLTNISQTGFEDVSLKKAQKALNEALMSKVGTDRSPTRPLALNKIKMSELEKEKASLNQKRESQIDYESSLNDFLSKKEKLSDKKKSLAILKDFSQTKKFILENTELKEKLERISTKISDGEREQQAVTKSIEEAKEERARHQSLSANNDENKNSQIKNGKDKEKHFFGLGLSFSILSIVSLIFGVMKGAFGYVVGAVFLITAVIFFILKNREVKRKTEEFEKSADEYKRLEQVVNSLIQRKKDLENINQANYETFSSVCGKHCESKNQMDNAIGELVIEIESLKKHLNEFNEDKIREEMRSIVPDFQRKQGNDIEMESEFFDSELKQTEDDEKEALLKIKEYETLLRDSSDDGEQLQKVEEDIAQLDIEKKSMEDLKFSLQKAMDLLGEVSSEMQKGFLPALNDKMSEYISRITGGRYSDLRADSSLALKAIVPEKDAVETVQHLSGGTIDQMYLALRIAAAEVISPSSKNLPFFMDEVFAQYDDFRTEETFKFLKKLADERQILFFTCKGREVEIAKRICGDEANIISLAI